jgi:hypothetical protein
MSFMMSRALMPEMDTSAPSARLGCFFTALRVLLLRGMTPVVNPPILMAEGVSVGDDGLPRRVRVSW